MEFHDLVTKRWAVRQYSDKPVEQEKLDLVLDAARLAPTSWNLQPQRVYVVRSEEGLEKLRAVTLMNFGAPISIVVCYDADEEWHAGLLGEAMPEAKEWEDFHTGILDACFVADHIVLQATDLGLGTCIIRGFDAATIHDALSLPEGSRIAVMIDLGYEDDYCIDSPGHLDGEPQRKKLSETTFEL